jgi:uncharacterized protein YggE
MAQQPVISVRGEGLIESEPEIATLSVTVQARDPDRRTVLDRLATRNAQVLDLIKGYGEAVEKLESGPASVYPDIKYKDRTERVRGYLGRASARVVLRDFTMLGELVTRLADGELVTVAGPWWSLRPESPVYRQARIAAAQDATRRAGEYAQAFGGELGELIEAADSGLLTGHAQQRAGFRAAAAVGVASASLAEPPAMEFEPVSQTVTAQVEARFGMLLPVSRLRAGG